MSACEHYQQQISQLLDGELPPEQVQTLRAHLRTCPECQRVYDDFLALQAAVRDAAAAPPADLTARIMQQVRQEPVPMPPRSAAPARPARHVQPTPIRRAAQPRPAARKRPAAGRTSPLLPISVMAACLALILGATLWFVPHRSQPSGADTALDNAQAPTVTLSPSVKEEDADGRKQDSLPAPESAPVLDDSVSSLLFSVPAESSADSTTLHISDRKTIEALSALLVRTQPVQPLDADRTPLCVLEETSADGVTTRVTVWCDGKDVVFVSSTDTQYYRVPDAAAEFCRLEVCNQNDFLSNEVFRLVPLCNTRNNLSAAHAVIQLQFQQLFRLFHLFACYDLCNPQINLCKIVNGDFRSQFCNWSSFFFCWLLRFVVLDDGV